MGIVVSGWLVVWTPLKNISQLGWLFPIYGKIKNVPNDQPVSSEFFTHIWDQLECRNEAVWCWWGSKCWTPKRKSSTHTFLADFDLSGSNHLMRIEHQQSEYVQYFVYWNLLKHGTCISCSFNQVYHSHSTRWYIPTGSNRVSTPVNALDQAWVWKLATPSKDPKKLSTWRGKPKNNVNTCDRLWQTFTMISLKCIQIYIYIYIII